MNKVQINVSSNLLKTVTFFIRTVLCVNSITSQNLLGHVELYYQNVYVRQKTITFSPADKFITWLYEAVSTIWNTILSLLCTKPCRNSIHKSLARMYVAEYCHLIGVVIRNSSAFLVHNLSICKYVATAINHLIWTVQKRKHKQTLFMHANHLIIIHTKIHFFQRAI